MHRFIRLGLASVALLLAGAAQSATLTYAFGVSFGDPFDTDTAPPDGPGPWLTAVFDDGGTPGSVTLTMTVASTVGIADVTGVYFNLNPALNPAALNIAYSSGQTQSGITNSSDCCAADGSGLYDLLISYANNTFSAGETSIFNITGIPGLVASDFLFYSAPPFGQSVGSKLAAAKFQSTGSNTVQCDSINGPIGQCSDWIAPAPIPVPASVWLFGSALGLLGWIRRRAP